MKKRTRNLVILGSVLVLLVGVYVAVSLVNAANTRRAAEAEADAVVYIGSIEGASKLTYTSEKAGALSFTLADGSWYWADDGELSLKQSYVTRIADALTGLTANRKLPMTESLSAYGLEEPAYTLEAEDTDGHALSLLIGKKTGDSYYAMERGGDEIYTIASTIPGYLDTGLFTMVTKDAFEGVDEEEARDITLTDGEGRTFTFSKLVKSNGTYTWYAEINGKQLDQLAVYEPVGESLLTASEHLDKVTGSLATLTLGDCVDFKPASAALTEYGLKNPALTVEVSYVLTDDDDVETKGEYTLYIGSASDEDGAKLYARMEGSNLVYLISADAIAPLTAALTALVK